MAERGGRDYSTKPQTNGERFNLIRELLSLLYYADYKSFRSTANQNRNLFRALRVITPANAPVPLPRYPPGAEAELHPARGARTRDAAPAEKTGRIPGEGWAGKAWRGRARKKGYGHLRGEEDGEIRKELACQVTLVGMLPVARRRCSWGRPYQDHFPPAALCTLSRQLLFSLLSPRIRDVLILQRARRSAAESQAPRCSCKLH